DVNGTARVSGDALVNGLTTGKGGGNISNNSAFGVSALSTNTTSSGNSAFGYFALKLSTGEQNSAFGTISLGVNSTGIQNSAFGSRSLESNTSGNSNSAFGFRALSGNTTGSNNIAIGVESLTSNTSGSNNIAIGKSTLIGNTTGIQNIAIGNNSNATTDGIQNTSIGHAAFTANSSGGQNTILGAFSATSNSTGTNNCTIGYNSFPNNTTGSNNLALGVFAGKFISGGSTDNTISNNSIFIGYDTRALANNQTNQIVIGYAETGLGSNTTIIGNSSTVTTAIRGRMLLGTTTDSGSYQLDVNGTARVSGNVDATSFNATGTISKTSGSFSFLDFAGGNGRLAAYNFTTNQWLPIVMGDSRLVMSNSLGSRTERLVGATAAFTGDVKMLSVNTFFGTTENNGIFAPSTYSNANYPVVENNSIGLIAGIASVDNPAFIVAQKISFQIGTGVNSKVAQFSPTTGNFIIQNGGTFTDNASALIQMNSSSKGFLPPRMTATQKNAIGTPASGLIVYDTTTNKLCCYNGSTWNDLF
ncbi:hypothetical protein UFOVP321_53, partial [uncultured Caudovirales phage]